MSNEYTSTHQGTQKILQDKIGSKLDSVAEDSTTGVLGYTVDFTDYSYLLETTITVQNNTDSVDINVNGVTIGTLNANGDVATVRHNVASGELTVSSSSNFDVDVISKVR